MLLAVRFFGDTQSACEQRLGLFVILSRDDWAGQSIERDDQLRVLLAEALLLELERALRERDGFVELAALERLTCFLIEFAGGFQIAYRFSRRGRWRRRPDRFGCRGRFGLGWRSGLGSGAGGREQFVKSGNQLIDYRFGKARQERAFVFQLLRPQRRIAHRVKIPLCLRVRRGEERISGERLNITVLEAGGRAAIEGFAVDQKDEIGFVSVPGEGKLLPFLEGLLDTSFNVSVRLTICAIRCHIDRL